jgi:hypothetical protein
MSESIGPTRRELLGTAAVAGSTLLSYRIPKWAEQAIGAGLPQVKPEDIGIDPNQLGIAYDLMKKWTSVKDARRRRLARRRPA